MTKGQLILLLSIALFLIGVGVFVFSWSTKEVTSVGESAGSSATALMAVNSEPEFLEYVMKQQEETIHLAQMVLQNGGTLRPIRNLATKIIKTESNELSKLRRQYQEQYGPLPGEPADTSVVSEALTGQRVDVAADRLFLGTMLTLDESLIAVSQKALTFTLSETSQVAAKQIIERKKLEITALQELYNLLPTDSP